MWSHARKRRSLSYDLTCGGGALVFRCAGKMRGPMEGSMTEGKKKARESLNGVKRTLNLLQYRRWLWDWVTPPPMHGLKVSSEHREKKCGLTEAFDTAGRAPVFGVFISCTVLCFLWCLKYKYFRKVLEHFCHGKPICFSPALTPMYFLSKSHENLTLTWGEEELFFILCFSLP